MTGVQNHFLQLDEVASYGKAYLDQLWKRMRAKKSVSQRFKKAVHT